MIAHLLAQPMKSMSPIPKKGGTPGIMSLIKRKLGSKAGASMLLALVFLMFCLFIGGSVLAAATANGSRVAHLKNDQQDYLSQRSAMLLMADMLTGEDGKELQVVITEVLVKTDGAETSHTITFTSPTVKKPSPPNALPASFLQKVMFEVVVDTFDKKGATPDYSYFDWIGDSAYSYCPTTGTIAIADGSEQGLEATYKIDTTSDYDLSIDFGDNTYISLSMDGSIGNSTPKTVRIGKTTTTTTTTIIRWSEPVLEKRGA